MTLHSALTAIVRAFISTPAERDEFVGLNRDLLSGLQPADKRALWTVMQECAA